MNIAIGRIGGLDWDTVDGKLLSRIVREYPRHKFYILNRAKDLKRTENLWSGFTSIHDYTYPTVNSLDIIFDGAIIINGRADNNVFPPKNSYEYTLVNVAALYHFLNIRRVRWMSIVTDDKTYVSGTQLTNTPRYIAGNSSYNVVYQPHYSDTRFRDLIYSKVKMGNEELVDIENNLEYLAHRLMNAFYREVKR